MDEEDVTIIRYLCKYHAKTLIFMLEDSDEKIEMDASNIITIEYLCDYDQNVRAILKLTLRLDIRKKLWVLKNKRKILCKFELCKSGLDTDQEEWVRPLEPVWDEEFSIYLSDEDESLDVPILEDRLKMNEEMPDMEELEAENYFESQNLCDVYLFNRKLLKASNTIYNEVYKENIMQNFIARVLTKTEHNKVLISKIENDEEYKELLVPPVPAYKALGWLDQKYGFYKKGAIIFYDVDMLYILNANGKVTAKQEEEWTQSTLLVTKLDSGLPGNGMIYREGEEIFYYTVPESAVFTQKYSLVNNVLTGGTTEQVDAKGTDPEEKKTDQEFIQQRFTNIIIQHDDDTKYAMETIKSRLEEAEIVMFISAENLDIKAFTPNKEFNIVFDSQTKQDKYGQYNFRLCYARHIIRAESEGYMSSTHQIILKRRPSDEEGEDESDDNS